MSGVRAHQMSLRLAQDRRSRNTQILCTGGLTENAGRSRLGRPRKMIQQGGAWYFERFGRDRSMLIAESIARRARAGLWALPDRERVPPWEWRKMPKEERDLHR
jgi:hypothetical protein